MGPFGCVKNTIRLRSGLYLNLADPKPDQLTLADIAGALSKICRFGGQCERFYSVAEHSYHCARLAENQGLPLDTQVALLFHDAAEAFIGDVVKPLKIMIPEYAQIERRIESVIAEKFTIDFEGESYDVQRIDHEMLIAERRAMFSPDKAKWEGEDEVRKVNVLFEAWPPPKAESMFLARSRCLGFSDEGNHRID